MADALKKLIRLKLLPKDPAEFRNGLRTGGIDYLVNQLEGISDGLDKAKMSPDAREALASEVFGYFPVGKDTDAAQSLEAAERLADAAYGPETNLRNKQPADTQDTPSGPLPENKADNAVLDDVPADKANPERDAMLAAGMSEADYKYLKKQMGDYDLTQMDAETAMETLQSYRDQDADAAKKAANRKKPGRKPKAQQAAAAPPTPAAPAPQMADTGSVVNRPGEVMSQDTIGGFSFTPIDLTETDGIVMADVADVPMATPDPNRVDDEIYALTALDPASSAAPPLAAIDPALDAETPSPSPAAVTQGLLDDAGPSAMDMSRLTDPSFGGVPLAQQNAARAARTAPPPPPDPFSGVDDPTGNYGSRFPFPPERSAMDMSKLSNPPVTDLIVPEQTPPSRSAQFLRAMGGFASKHPIWTTAGVLGAGGAAMALRNAYNSSVDNQQTRDVLDQQYQNALRRVQEMSDYDLTLPRR